MVYFQYKGKAMFTKVIVMAKSKNSKILAMALCACVMAGIYATPVMAGDLSVTLDGQGIVAREELPLGYHEDHNVLGTFTIGETQLTTALSGTDLTLNSISASTISGTTAKIGDVEIANGKVDGVDVSTLSNAATDITELQNKTQNITATNGKTNFAGDVAVAGSFSAANGAFAVDDSGDVTANKVSVGQTTITGSSVTTDVISANEAQVGGVEIQNNAVRASNVLSANYNLEEVGANTQHITHNENGTHIEGVATFNNDGMTVGDNFSVNAATGAVTAGNGSVVGGVGFTDGALTGVTGINANSTTQFKLGQINVSGRNLSNVGYISGETLNFKTLNMGANGNDTEAQITEQKVRAYNKAINAETGALTGADGSVIGGVELTKGTVDGVDVSDLSETVDGATVDITELKNKTQNIDVEKTDSTKTTFNSSVIAESFKTQNNKFYVTEDGSMVAANGAFKVTNDGATTATNFVTTDGADLNKVNDNTAAITRTQNEDGVYKTTVSDRLYVDSITQNSGGFWISANGQASFSRGQVLIDYDGNLDLSKATSGNISMKDGATVDGVDVSELSSAAGDISDLQHKTQNINSAGTYEGTTTFDGNVLATGTISNGRFTATNDGNVIANNFTGSNFVTTSGADLNAINANVAGVSREELADGSGITTIEGATTFDQAGMSIKTEQGTSAIIGGQAMFNDGNSITQIMGGDITAETLNGKDIDDLVVGADIETDLANIAGISREELADGSGITTIEGATTFDQAGMSITSDRGVTAIVGGQATFRDGDSFTQIMGGAITADTLNGKNINEMFGKLDDVYNRTQGIDYDATTGTTTIDGNLVVEGDATTGAGGDAEIGGDAVIGNDLTVGGDANIDGNANVTGNVNVDGQINVGSTVVDKNGITAENGTFTNVTAANGNIGGVTLKDNTVTAEKVVAGGNVLDENGLTVGNDTGSVTSVTADGVNVGGAEGTSIKHDEISVGDGGYIGGGDVVTGEGVSVNQTAERVGHLENRVGELEDRIDKVGAMAAAIANLRTMGYDPAAPTEVAVGLGQYRDETGAALGLFHYPNRDFMLSLSVSTSGDEVMGGIGATWKFGRKSPEKVAEIKKAQAEADVRRAEAQKLAKAEELKEAAREAKIKAQMERHAKLAAERAAQAEAK